MEESTRRRTMRTCSSKVGLVVLHWVFMLVSFVLIITGFSLHDILQQTPSLINQHLAGPVSAWTALGILMLCVSLFAETSIFCANRLLLLAYFCLLLLLILIELGVGVAGYVSRSHIYKLICDTLLSAERNYLSDRMAYQTWDSLQRGLGCCGINNYTEWFEYLGNSNLPDSCCFGNFTVGFGCDALLTDNFYRIDCNLAIREFVQKPEMIVVICFPFLLGLKVIALFLSCDHIKAVHGESYARIT